MILLVALVAGLIVGFVGAHWHKEPYQVPALKALWLAFIAFIPQIFIAYVPASRHILPDGPAALGLFLSLTLFLAFAWLNRHLPGIQILLVGLVLNLAVMMANGGWMPISPKTASRLVGTVAVQTISLGDRFGQKDVLLDPQSTHLEYLADRFLLPAWLPYQAAFSLGDILIAIGMFWLLAIPISNTNKKRVIT